ncbi:MAG: UDP-3-O-(3-hydroxymyristoyl)glucosamine N-acyltransferase [Opitutales bacterium]|nr:UDP-3-O-(3-hydroxymyristoyl)glucosamine N-acyltransferase [Opitutales bacterium]
MTYNHKTIQELAEHVGGTIEGDGNIEISGAATLSEACESDVSFLANSKYEKELETTKAGVVVVDMEVDRVRHNVIRCKDPYYAFMQMVVLLHGHREHKHTGISKKASVAETAKIGENVDIHDFVHVADGVEIGDGTNIYPSCTIGPGSKIGKDCIIYPNVTIYDGCVIGDRVTIHAGTVVGQDGFGYATHDGVHHKIPQIGGVVIEDDVELGANCTIDRGTLGDTVIGKGTKTSNLIAIGHNTRVGEHCLLVAQVGIAGSVEVGNYCVFGGQVGVVGHIKIGNNVQIGAQAGVTHDLEGNQAVVGSPAIPMSQARRSYALLKDLPEFRKKLRAIDRQITKMVAEEDEE